MKREQLTCTKVTELLAPVFKQYNVKSAVLFGSVAQGTATENSDVDILVDSGLRGLDFCGLMEDIRETVQVPVDVIDVTHIEQESRIDEEIHNTGILIYEK